jgi:hypothetical protein
MGSKPSYMSTNKYNGARGGSHLSPALLSHKRQQSPASVHPEFLFQTDSPRSPEQAI